ncbi:hypothetical protein T492DRAFT_1059530 [Pavlovales sp. CCMP2436]|nr:hypothetical protein T492DRAFT_1059530 [Pavlovales sp. CCMP2436]|mmetsp:Transcript_18895/g.48182  ORF Transcript_18895/g.48182 Transcript_18895/m.48182 type:complete len:196 (-) Transcript_18895:128-715(-)
MVGFAPRLLLPTGGYNWKESFRRQYRKNTLFVTKGAFVHRDDFKLFWLPQFAPLVEQVDAHTTGEDISFSVIFAALRGLPPVHLAAHLSQMTELCCTGSTQRADGLASVSPHNALARDADPVCSQSKGSTLHSRTADFRDAIQRQAVRLAGDAIYHLGVSNTTLLPSTYRLLVPAMGYSTSPNRAYGQKRLVSVR